MSARSNEVSFSEKENSLRESGAIPQQNAMTRFSGAKCRFPAARRWAMERDGKRAKRPLQCEPMPIIGPATPSAYPARHVRFDASS
jgi:hypothetical protein